MDVANANLGFLSSPSAPIPTYKAQGFDKMIADTKPDEVVITTTGSHPRHLYYQSTGVELQCDN